MKDEEIADYKIWQIHCSSSLKLLSCDCFFLNGIEQQFSKLSEVVKSYLDKKKQTTAAMDRSHVLTCKKLNSLSCVFKITSQLELIAKIFQSL